MKSSLSNLQPRKYFNKLVPPQTICYQDFFFFSLFSLSPLHMSGSFCQRVLLARRNDSNRGSVKSTGSSSEACQLLLLEVKRINLSINSLETVSASLLIPTRSILSISTGSELSVDSLLDEAGLISSVSIGPDSCSEL